MTSSPKSLLVSAGPQTTLLAAFQAFPTSKLFPIISISSITYIPCYVEIAGSGVNRDKTEG
jgi:hypothetical protein